jgi:hypothetical protein
VTRLPAGFHIVTEDPNLDVDELTADLVDLWDIDDEDPRRSQDPLHDMRDCFDADAYYDGEDLAA